MSREIYLALVAGYLLAVGVVAELVRTRRLKREANGQKQGDFFMDGTFQLEPPHEPQRREAVVR
jgi:hypothetical protein